jgi:hypothetical protein
MHLDDVAIGIVDEGLLPARQPTSHHHRQKGMFSSTHHESGDFVREGFVPMPREIRSLARMRSARAQI